MNFTGIENHDDFYTLDSSCADIGLSGRTTATTWKSNITAASASYTNSGFDIPHVQDLCGFYIVYDAALSDFENLENELLFMASYFIEKDIGKCYNYSNSKVLNMITGNFDNYKNIRKSPSNYYHFIF